MVNLAHIAEPLRKLAVPIADLGYDPENVRLHDERNLEAVRVSLERFGQRQPLVVQREGMIVRAGNARLLCARSLGWTHVAAVVVDEADAEATAFAIADNRTAELAEWSGENLAKILADLPTELRDASGYSENELAELVADVTPPPEIVEDEVPEPPVDPITKPGDLWALGDHRVLCGDSTKSEDVARVMGGAKAALVHADPPYGMGKEADGIANDNLYAEKLDAFQMAWWTAARPHVEDNGSAYVWGNAEDLWRLWYSGGLKAIERLTLRNEVVWAKGTAGAGGISHQGADGLRLYPQETERCLFFMLGEQGFNNNADNYWEGWDSVVDYLRAEKEKTGWDIAKFKRLAGHSETSGCHWFDKSQWSFPTKEVYESWQDAAREHGAFKREYDELKREHDELKREHDELKREFYATRAFFDNTHDNMTDVWSFPRVTGEDRHDHATPKPVAMIGRAIKSSCPEGAAVLDPFLGSGTTLIAAEQLGRTCYGIEIEPRYCDVIVQRWETLTGKKAHREK